MTIDWNQWQLNVRHASINNAAGEESKDIRKYERNYAFDRNQNQVQKDFAKYDFEQATNGKDDQFAWVETGKG